MKPPRDTYPDPPGAIWIISEECQKLWPGGAPRDYPGAINWIPAGHQVDVTRDPSGRTYITIQPWPPGRRPWWRRLFG